MHTQVDKASENANSTLANAHVKEQGEGAALQVDQRMEAITQRKLQGMANNSPRVKQLMAFQQMANKGARGGQPAQMKAKAEFHGGGELQPIQKKENNTGLPDNLKSGIEHLSGYSMDDVKVHCNSDKPAQLQAHAYAQGAEIHLGAGQEKHLPHEAWHVVQQKQGRVRPTVQMSKEGGDSAFSGMEGEDNNVCLERKTDTWAGKAIQRSLNAPFLYNEGIRPSIFPIVQMVKYVKAQNGKIHRREDESIVKKGEEEVNRTAYQNYLFGELTKDKIKSFAPTVMGTATKKDTLNPSRIDLTDKLIYRGMSVNNIANLRSGNESIFTANNPLGKASAVKHIVDDDEDSPYLSFEGQGLGISAGKYAHKPVDDDNQPIGVKTLSTGFLKQEKSYTQENMEENQNRKRIGVVAGIMKKTSYLDVSDENKAKNQLNSQNKTEGDEVTAVNLAVADKEILVKPGINGISKGDVPFYAKVEVVDKGYFIRNIDNQTKTMALGFHNGTFYKIQIDVSRSDAQFHFQFSLDAEFSGGGDAIADIDDIEINKELFSLTKEQQEVVRNELPKKSTLLSKVVSVIEGTGKKLKAIDVDADQKTLSGFKSKKSQIAEKISELNSWLNGFDDGENDKLLSIEEITEFKQELNAAEDKNKDLGTQIEIVGKVLGVQVGLKKIGEDATRLLEQEEGKVQSKYAAFKEFSGALEEKYLAIHKLLEDEGISKISQSKVLESFQGKLTEIGKQFETFNELLKKLNPDVVV